MTIHDLTRPITDGMPGYPGDPPVELTPYADVPADGFRAAELSMTTHTGTHVDAPAHTEPDGRTIDDYPVERFRFDAARLDLGVEAPRERIDRATITNAAREVLADAPRAVDMLVLDTGWATHWGEDRYADHPFLTPAAADWFAEEGYHVGLDTLGVDPTPTPNARADEPGGLPAHHALLGAGLFVVENLVNLAALPDLFRLSAYPLAVVDGDAAPARVVAETAAP